ncbi:MAG: hypothetical protein ABIG63_13300 [Chloroflexota bacterium]
MSDDEKMTIDERRKYLRKMQKKYNQATRQERGRLLNEMEVVTELHRKSPFRLVNGKLTRKPRHNQRGRSNGVEIDDALRVIAESLDYVCAESLQPNGVLRNLAALALGHPNTRTKLSKSPRLSPWRRVGRAYCYALPP